MINKMLKNNQMYEGKELRFFCPAGQRINMSGIYPFVIYELVPVDEEHTDYKEHAIVAVVNDGSVYKTKFLRDIFILIKSMKINIISYKGMNPLDHKFMTTDEILTVKVPTKLTNNQDMMRSIVAEELQERFPTKETLEEADDFEIEGEDMEWDQVTLPYEMPDEAWKKGAMAQQMKEELGRRAAKKKQEYEAKIKEEAAKIAARELDKQDEKSENEPAP